MSSVPYDNSHLGFSDSDLDRIRSEAPIGYLEFHQELPSTNDLALELSGQEEVPLPLLVLTQNQTAGRGQRTRHWWSFPGALTFSLAICTNELELPPELWPKVSLTAGLAICETLEELLPGEEVRIKWPNDVHIQNKKICGILVESPGVQQRRLVIGIGINVNNTVAEAPAEVAEIATAMCDLKGDPTPLADVLVKVVRQLVDRLQCIGTGDDQLVEQLRDRSLLTDLRVVVENATGQCSGICRGIDGDGALLVETDSGVQRCLAGTVAIVKE